LRMSKLNTEYLRIKQELDAYKALKE